MPHRPALALLLLATLFSACGYSKDIKEYPEPWQTLDPGKPLEKFPKIEILEQGSGAVIEPGDLVQIHVKDWSPYHNGWREMGYWWIWAGFLSSKKSAFFSIEPDMAGALLGLHQSVSFKLLEGKEAQRRINGQVVTNRSGQLKLRVNPFGDAEYYSWRKNTNDNLALSEVSNSGYYSVLTVKRVCKGPLQYRTVRLFDDSPVRVSAGGFSTRVIRDARQIWIDEAKIEATCQDGRKVKFQYGPVSSRSGGRPNVPISGYFDDWYNKAWDSIPLGVQFEGNRPPVVKGPTLSLLLHTRRDTPVKVDFSSEAKDPDGDRLKIRFFGPPANGTMTENPDGTFTYAPKRGWAGTEEMRYKASDGLVESESFGRVVIHVEQPKK